MNCCAVLSPASSTQALCAARTTEHLLFLRPRPSRPRPTGGPAQWRPAHWRCSLVALATPPRQSSGLGVPQGNAVATATVGRVRPGTGSRVFIPADTDAVAPETRGPSGYRARRGSEASSRGALWAPAASRWGSRSNAAGPLAALSVQFSRSVVSDSL